MTDLDFPQPDGSTKRQHYRQLEKLTGKKRPELDEKIVPFDCAKAYQVFLALSRTRDGGPISFLEMKAYSDLTGYQLSKNEIDAIQRFDSALLNKRNELILEQRKHSVSK